MAKRKIIKRDTPKKLPTLKESIKLTSEHPLNRWKSSEFDDKLEVLTTRYNKKYNKMIQKGYQPENNSALVREIEEIGTDFTKMNVNEKRKLYTKLRELEINPRKTLTITGYEQAMKDRLGLKYDYVVDGVKVSYADYLKADNSRRAQIVSKGFLNSKELNKLLKNPKLTKEFWETFNKLKEVSGALQHEIETKAYRGVTFLLETIINNKKGYTVEELMEIMQNKIDELDMEEYRKRKIQGSYSI